MTDWYDTHVLEVVQETPIDRSFRLAVPPEAAGGFAFAPGQFVTLRDPAWEKKIQRAYTISSAPGENGAIELTVRDMGSFGHSLYGAKAGKTFRIRPPQGRFVLNLDADDRLVMTAGGSGVTPFRSFVRHLVHVGNERPACLVQCGQQAEQLIFRAEFERHAREHPWFDYRPTVTRAADDDPWTGRRGRIDLALLRDVIADPARTRFYACGPGAFVKALLELAGEAGVPKERRHKEQWG